MNIESQRRYRTYLIVLVYLIMAMKGIRLGRYQYISIGIEFAYSLALALILTEICIVDSRIVGKPLSIFNYWIVFMFYGYAVPVCIIRARGKFGLVIVVAHFIGLMLIHVISSLLTSYLVFGRFFI
ncbi:MAG: hypothetical protein GY845_31835 [Planctomycetes bacterium]|nr:hypothetical protein [Planctomycetota bacterium]